MKICTAYELDGQRITDFPATSTTCAACQPVYETLPGWNDDITGIRRTRRPARQRQEDISIASAELVGRPVEVVSVGPDREQTMFTGSMA